MKELTAEEAEKVLTEMGMNYDAPVRRYWVQVTDQGARGMVSYIQQKTTLGFDRSKVVEEPVTSWFGTCEEVVAAMVEQHAIASRSMVPSYVEGLTHRYRKILEATK